MDFHSPLSLQNPALPSPMCETKRPIGEKITAIRVQATEGASSPFDLANVSNLWCTSLSAALLDASHSESVGKASSMGYLLSVINFLRILHVTLETYSEPMCEFAA